MGPTIFMPHGTPPAPGHGNLEREEVELHWRKDQSGDDPAFGRKQEARNPKRIIRSPAPSFLASWLPASSFLQSKVESGKEKEAKAAYGNKALPSIPDSNKRAQDQEHE